MIAVTQESLEAESSPGTGDFFLLALTFVLVGFGLLMVYSTSMAMSQSRFGTPYHFVSRQSVAAMIGFIGLLLMSRVSLDQVRRVSPYLLLAAIAVLILPLIPGLGHTANGATRWVSLPGIRFQPSELARPCFVIFLAGYFARQQSKLDRFSYSLLRPLLILGLVSSFLLLQPDFGSTAILAAITIGMALAAGVPWKHLLILAGSLISLGATLIMTSPYRFERVLSFLDPVKDRFGRGYQLVQSLIAVATGEFNGKGFGNSTQKLHYLPDAHTDFIFAVIAEELGFAGSITVIILFLLLLWRGCIIASRFTEDTFYFTLATGLTLLLVVPGLINIGVVTGVLPTKGLPLPFIGYGGTSMVSGLLIIGLLFGLSRKGKSSGAYGDDH